MRKLLLLLTLIPSIALAQVGDGQFISDGALTNGSPTLTSAKGKFASGDVGKSIQCGPANFSGNIVDTTIKTFVKTTEVELSTNSSKTASSLLCQWGTDNTSAFNSAIAKSGIVQIGQGCFLHRSLNITHKNGLIIQGSGNPVNNHGDPCKGTWMIMAQSDKPAFDLTGSAGITIRDLQIGTTLSPTNGNIGIWVAHSTTVTATKIRIENIFVVGAWQLALGVYGVAALNVRDADFVTYRPDWIAVMLSGDNPYGFSSQYATVATGSYGTSALFENVEMHAYIQGGGSTAGHALRMRGVAPFACKWCLLDSSSYNATVMLEETSAGLDNFLHYWENSTVYNEQSPQAVHCWKVNSGTYTSVTMLLTTCTSSGAAVSGTISYLGFITP